MSQEGQLHDRESLRAVSGKTQNVLHTTVRRRIFDGERLSELMVPLNIGWKVRTHKELARMEELTPLLHKLAQGTEISGLAAYEEGR